MRLRRLPSGYWQAWWNCNRWIQWPCDRKAMLKDGFGWITQRDVDEANEAARKARRREI